MNIASLRSVQTPRELEALAPLDEIKSTLEREISPLQVPADSYDEMYQVIAKLQGHWDSLQKDAYFKNENSRYIYALVYSNKEDCYRAIGWDDSLYRDTEKAKKWYRSVAGKVHPDHNPENQEDAARAFENLQRLYKSMQWASKDDPEMKGGQA